MPLQIRPQEGDKRFYDPNRDFAHCFPAIAQEVAHRIDSNKWPALVNYLEAKGVEIEDLEKTFTAVHKFILSATDNPKESLEDCLRRSGYLQLRSEAQFAYLAVMGGVIMGCFFSGRRHAYLGADTMDMPYSIVTYGRRLSLIFSMPPWRRKLYFAWRSVKRSFRSFRKEMKDR